MHDLRKLLPLFGSLAVCAVLGCLAVRELQAAPPRNWLIPFKSVDTDPQSMYTLTPENGPWMIMATSFTGDTEETRAKATDQARELVHELRRRYKLPAYTWEKQFDFSKGTEGRGINRYGEPMKMKYNHDKDVFEIAVLVGDYATVTDPEAQRVLKKIKLLEPECLQSKDGKSTNQALATLRNMQKSVLTDESDWKKHGSMGQAFVVTNPLLPKEYFAPKGIDKLVVDMNKGVEHDLLNCGARYTVKVATFTGQTTLINHKVEELLEKGAVPKSHLADAAMKANTLTEALRAKGYEAYEFHDRYSSIVTVGSFDNYGTKGLDGKINLEPQVFKIMKTFGAEQKDGATAPVPKSLLKIPFDVQPMIVEVPVRSISSDYSRNE